VEPDRAVWARSSSQGPLVIGHRGASAREPENSLPAFRRAVLDGADGVELDVLCCATGEVVVFHDDDLLRLAGRPERVASLPWAALAEVTLSGGVRIPTLEEALEACGPALLVNVELKSDGLRDRHLPTLLAGVEAAVDRADAARRVLVSSFSPAAVWRWRRRRPDVKAALLFEREAPLPLRQAWALPLLRPFAVHPDQRLCTPAAIRRWHAAGYAVNTWTVDDPGRLRALREMQVDAVITNDPAAARTALR
jgi:glycerophosphoryl diester phosphodiesterase